jgi:FkbM family methyltransferase
MAMTGLVPTRRLRAAAYRSLSWKLVDGLPARIEASAVGGRMVVDRKSLLGRVVAISGEWEPHVTNEFRKRLAPGDVCVDVGAHVGYYTLLASRLVGSGGHVYAFEPVPACNRALRHNLELNGRANVTVFDVAAGAREATEVLLVAPGANPETSSVSQRVLEDPHGGEASQFTRTDVRTRAVDAVLPRARFTRVRVLKVDVEGFEVEVLRGVEGILSAGAPIAVFVELSPGWSEEDPAAFVDALCRRHELIPWRLVNDYTPAGYFPSRLVPPARLERIPVERCDLLLTRT